MENFRPEYDLEKLKSLYNRYSFKPWPAKVSFVDENLDGGLPRVVKVWWKVRDTFQVKTSISQKTYLHNGKQYETIGLPEEIADNGAQATSYNGKRTVVLKSKDSKSGKPEQYVAIYDSDGTVNTISIKSLNDEMSILENQLASLVLSPDGKLLLCVVEVQAKTKDESPAVAKDYDLNSHEYKQSWGEKFSTTTHTSIALIDLETRKHVLIDKIGVSLCRPFFYKSNDSSIAIGCIGFQELPFKLGLIYCTNRVSFLFGCKVVNDFSVSQVEPEIFYGQSGQLALDSPRVYYNNKTGYDDCVIFLERNASNAHNNAAKLQHFSMNTRKLRTIVDNKASREVVKLANNEITYSELGPLFLLELPAKCFTEDGKFIILDSDTPFTTRTFAIGFEDGKMHALNIPLDSSEVLEVRNDWICINASSINQLPNVYIGRFVDPSHGKIQWMALEDEKSRVVSNIKYGTYMFPSRDFAGKYVTGIWTSPSDLVNKDSPMVFIPHGGPHSHYSTTFLRSIALYNEIGLKTCLINYVGSTGVDEDYVNVLLGKVGTTDVHDFYDSIQYMIKHFHADKDRIILNGGSHGGFLVTQISGQHPEMNFLACIARNPVIDVSVMSGITDIPDWDMAEALGESNRRPLSEMYPRNADEMAKMYRVSPIAHIEKVKVPTLLLLGREDLRVPHPQGLMYHRLLKARGIETRCLIYDDVHDLMKINVDFDCFLNVAKFVEKFIYYTSP